MNIAFDAGAIEVAKGSGIGNYTINQFISLVKMYPEDNFYYFNVIGDSELTSPIIGDNFDKINYFTGKDFMLRQFDGEYKDVMGQLVRNFIRKYKIDVFYITAPFLTQGGLGYNVLYEEEWFDGITVVATLYDVIPYIMRKEYLSNKADYNCYMGCVNMLKWTDCQLAISESAKEDAIKYLDFNPDKISVILGGVSEKYHEMDISETQKKVILPKFDIHSEFILCCVSADQRKNTQKAIEAYALLPEKLKGKYQLVVVGRLSQDGAVRYNKLVKSLHLVGNVVLTDFITDDELIELYNLAKLMIIPSLYEGFGLPVIEAWACGTPVISSYNSSLGEVTGDAGLLFDPKDIKDMARVMEEALTTADLQMLLERGKKKLKLFQWDHVAELTHEAIVHTIVNKKCAKQKQKIACVLLDNQNYDDAFGNIISVFSDLCEIDLFGTLSIEEYNRNLNIYSISSLNNRYKNYDHVVYFAEEEVSKENYEIMQSLPGIWFVLEENLWKIALLLKDSEGSESQYRIITNKMSRYFRTQNSTHMIKKDLLCTCKKVITVSDEIKKELLNETLDKAVYSIAPYDVSNNLNINREMLVKTFCDNFISAITDHDLFIGRERALNSILNEQIIPKSYNETELRDISATLGFVMNTSHIMKYISECECSKQITNDICLRVDLVTSWNTKCGIAEYTKYYVDKELENVNFNIFPNIVNETIRKDEKYVNERLWKFHESTENLTKELLKSEADIVHIQYTEGFFVTSDLAQMIKQISTSKKVIITCHNTKFLLPDNHNERVALNLADYVVHQTDDINVLINNGISKNRIHLIPLGQMEATPMIMDDIRKILGITKNYPVIGSYGFLLPHKGIFETIQAISILREVYPDILYIASCSIYDVDPSRDYYKKCYDLVKKDHLENHVKLITDFLKPVESLTLLQACDAFAMPYAPTNESASGAVRFCIAAKRPIVVTEQPIFQEYMDCTIQIPTNEAINIANGIKEILSPEKYPSYCKAVTERAQKSTWSVVGKKYLDLYRGLISNLKN